MPIRRSLLGAAVAERGRPEGPLDVDEEARRRRHPAERLASRFSGLLLLIAIPHATFGYALVDLVPGPGWVRTTHFLIAPVVLLLGLLLFRAVSRLPWRHRRERVLLVLAGTVVLFSLFQLVSGLWMRWGLPGAADLWIYHIGFGILNTVTVALVHVVAILPSILVSARKEHAELTSGRNR